MSSARPFPDEPLVNPNEDLDDQGLLLASFDEAERRNLDAAEEQDDSEEGVNDTFDSTEDRSLVFDLHSHLTDNEIADVSLCGTDGKSVVAVRSILAMRSRFFKTLFFGQFRERGMDQVPLGYSSLVLKAVVEYCYTDEIKTAFENLSFEETARSMVGLVAAGNYFELQGLMSRAYRLTCLMMDEYPALSCAVLDEVSVSGGGHHASELSRVALGIIRLRPESALLPPDTYGLGVRSLSAAAMECVMADNEIQTKELTLFQCLEKWAEYVPPSQEQDAVLQERRTTARAMAAHIDFSKISPSSLCTIVAESGLVPEHLLLNAYCSQALQAERNGITFSQVRCTLDNMITTNSGRIMVQGAGLAAVNGMYTSCSVFHNPLRYSRRGSLPGFGSGTFVLQTFVLQDGIKKWFLSFVNISLKPLDLYSAPVLSDMDPPPMQKWSSVTVGHEKLRTMQTRKNEVKQKHTWFDSSQHGDDGGLGYPPPICIWLPNDSKSDA
jgi:hypothetical protein